MPHNHLVTPVLRHLTLFSGLHRHSHTLKKKKKQNKTQSCRHLHSLDFLLLPGNVKSYLGVATGGPHGTAGPSSLLGGAHVCYGSEETLQLVVAFVAMAGWPVSAPLMEQAMCDSC